METTASIGTILAIAPFVILFFVAMSAFFKVDQQSVAIIERFGKFLRTAQPGLNVRIPLIDQIKGRVSLRVLQLDVKVETKTKDNVFVDIMISVQYRILAQNIFEAFYVLEDPDTQIKSFVFDVVRARVPKIDLDDVFEKKDEIADSVKNELSEVMSEFGFEIVKALVTDITPDARVKSAMNEINEAQRLRIAANERGEAEKILKVKQGEAEAEVKILQGKGLAGQRRAIVDGLRDSLDDFKKSIPSSNTQDVMSLILMTQYFDTLKEMSITGKTNTIMLPHSPSGLNDLADQIRTAVFTGTQMSQIVEDAETNRPRGTPKGK
jgi:regulator of protease activity HflC (stomatin/prohibitin superfamily)